MTGFNEASGILTWGEFRPPRLRRVPPNARAIADAPRPRRLRWLPINAARWSPGCRRLGGRPAAGELVVAPARTPVRAAGFWGLECKVFRQR
jgi:hypothetical protein